MLLVLKLWAFSFRGSGRTKYAYEVLHLLHNITHVWPKPVVFARFYFWWCWSADNHVCRKIVLNNWLVNPTGKANSFVELDLMQEHLNYWIKVCGCRARAPHPPCKTVTTPNRTTTKRMAVAHHGNGLQQSRLALKFFGDSLLR